MFKRMLEATAVATGLIALTFGGYKAWVWARAPDGLPCGVMMGVRDPSAGKLAETNEEFIRRWSQTLRTR